MTPRPRLPDWESKKAAIALSKERRELLREFAQSIDPEMGKAAALYELIDAALPWVKGPSMPTEAEEARALAKRSALALERVAATLAPFEDLISAQGDQGRGTPATPATSYEPGQWISGALARLGARPERLALTLNCFSTFLDGRRVGLLFSVSRVQLDEQTFYTTASGLPTLALSASLTSSLADITPSTLAAGVALRARRCPSGWSCELRSLASASRPPLHCFDC